MRIINNSFFEYLSDSLTQSNIALENQVAYGLLRAATERSYVKIVVVFKRHG